eukprot:TRINITY_DN12363_c0_g1_i1.p1 TRINITY_DN12363_c0_g1~~TRINITY_DN12363_c0_g1_i1.p1  ORF type:complete len:364 (+),score=111.90 TRINITY_DN12363_c0_g1_i1:103-1092(+)
MAERKSSGMKNAGSVATVLAVSTVGWLSWFASLPRTELISERGPIPNFRGVPIKQLPQLIPQLAGTYAAAETGYNVGPLLQWSKDHWEVPIVAVALYVVMVFAGPKMMEGRKPFDLRGLLAAWNCLLSVFSTVGALRTVPHLAYNLKEYGFRHTICAEPATFWGAGGTGLWVQLFIFSKIPELVDTFFIVVHKKPLTFLHWYHHITVLLYCWHSYATECGAGLWFCAMNYTVHAVMYAYFSAATLRMVPAWFPASVITAAQIAQMFVGMAVCASSMYFVAWDTSSPCNNDRMNLVAGGLMYVSYLYLFVAFAVDRYIVKPRRKAAGKSD